MNSNMYLYIFICHLLKNKRLLIPHGVDGVGCGGPLGAVLLLGVPRQPDHLHLHSRLHVLVRQKLARVDLVGTFDDIHVRSGSVTVWMRPVVWTRVQDTVGINRALVFTHAESEYQEPYISLSRKLVLLQDSSSTHTHTHIHTSQGYSG